MAYTAAQWAKFQQSLPQEDRMSYADYLASSTPAPAAQAPTKVVAKTGDTLASIAKANNTTVQEILAVNPVLAQRVADGEKAVFNNTKVTVPAPAAATQAAPTPAATPETMPLPNTAYTASTYVPSSGYVAPAAPSSTATDAPTKVVAKTGDTLASIAKANGTTVQEILAANPVLAERVAAGEKAVFNNTKVTVPAPAATPAAQAQTPASTGGLPDTAYTAGTYVPSSGYVAPTPRVDGLPDTTYNQGTYVPSSGYVAPPGGSTAGTPPVTPPPVTPPVVTPPAGSDENPPMPSDEEMAAADAAYQDALKANQKNNFPPVGTVIRYDAGSSDNSRIPVYADGAGGEFNGVETFNPVNPGSTGTEYTSATTLSERTLAKDTFANTLALLLGANEASQPWVNEMYNLTSGFYNTGSTIEEALNLSLYEAKQKGLAPQFTKRFAGVFALQDKLQKGEAVTVPTIAEFIKSEAAIGDTLRTAGLGDIATQDFIGNVIGAGNSVLDVGNLISSTFTTIDNAPAALRKTLDTYFPSVDRVSLAKALLTGTEGYQALDKKIRGISVLSAAGSQGISTDLATASDLAARGFDYGQALTGFGQVKELQRADTLAKMQGYDFTQKEAIGYTFEQNQSAKEKAEKIKATEIGKFQGEAGLSASALRGKNARQQI